MKVPRSHPRYKSLMIREELVRGFDAGLVATEGLMAHGRGEAFDYMMGEQTGEAARRAIGAAAAALLMADRPVISVNGNTAALCAKGVARLARAAGAKVEVNIFYGGSDRKERIARLLRECGVRRVYGVKKESTGRLSGTDSPRRVVDINGILASDLVLVPLEDGDRTAALKSAGKKVVTFDLNPLSRTAQTADITIVDNIVRGMEELVLAVTRCSSMSTPQLRDVIKNFDNKENLARSIKEIRGNLAQVGQ